MPPDHPPATCQDTFYSERGRAPPATHTSSPRSATWWRTGTRRTCGSSAPAGLPPDSDVTHSPMFQQIEGSSWVGHTPRHLKGTIEAFLHALREQYPVRFAPLLPYTEPSSRPISLHRVRRVGASAPLRAASASHGWLEILGPDGEPGGLRAVNARLGAPSTTRRRSRVSPSAWHRAGGDGPDGSTTSASSTRTTCASWSSSPDEDPLSWLREYVRRGRAPASPRRSRAGLAWMRSNAGDDTVLDLDITTNRSTA